MNNLEKKIIALLKEDARYSAQKIAVMLGATETEVAQTIKDLERLLFEDLRIDEDKFNELNKQDILELAPLYRSTNLNLLIKLLKGEK